METKTRGWPEKRRKEQAARLRKTKPWQQSTGPKTKQGKETCANNPIKHGAHTKEMKEIKQLLKQQRDYLRQIETRYKKS